MNYKEFGKQNSDVIILLHGGFKMIFMSFFQYWTVMQKAIGILQL